MPSPALTDWQGRLGERLGALEARHGHAVAIDPTRRWDTVQFHGHLFVALVGQFQGFARALHDDALVWLRGHSDVARVLADNAAVGRQLDRGNPHL